MVSHPVNPPPPPLPQMTCNPALFFWQTTFLFPHNVIFDYYPLPEHNNLNDDESVNIKVRILVHY